MKKLILMLLAACSLQSSYAQPQQYGTLIKASWPCYWITCADAAQREYGVYHFRKDFSLTAKPSSFLIHVSADNRYRLFVNGTPVCSGPARGDLSHWYYETIDIGPLLRAGQNTLAALVWNMGILAPVAQISSQTAFMLQGNTPAEYIVNTDSGWKTMIDHAYSPCATDNRERLQVYMVVGPGDRVEGSRYPWDWEKPDYDDHKWNPAAQLDHPEPDGHGTDNRWTLVPRDIPLLFEKVQRFSCLRRSQDLSSPAAFWLGGHPLLIPAHTRVSLLLDAGENIAAYPELLLSGGAGSAATLTYAESLFDSSGNKGNRNEIKDKTIKGNYDTFITDGGTLRHYRPLWFRAYRYLQLDITTQQEPLVLEDLYSSKTGYPLIKKARFSSDDPSLLNIWNTAWRTAQLCAGETYYDTPYYEQLQYTGDTRIQALISLYMTGDDRLMRKAILDFYHSRTAEGLTQGRYPSNRLQVIPPFSLFWVDMIHDYWMHCRDDAFVGQFIPAINEILSWFHARTDRQQHMLGPLSWWNFTDWDNFNSWGTAPGAESGNSSILTLQYACTLEKAAELHQAFGQPELGRLELAAADTLSASTFRKCYNSKRVYSG